ncbi:dTDP-4-dehydrorhamnose 3,5-epimerase [Paenibacillus aquistagni]|uniref:dTDP-4-dehydrorhamnose 3,5-epimerase n=1 Tax=Paenibacillus aquistagni TaxID=1852522 RepID=UPI00145C0740|nr:dTDP-4-dehydrorhamnose 3,5-epimerase [Paenibacillus aquistagni]NMM54262.1 dTDP-4-dehydrorhamnose 3,5-epimerase [Paenibacillus aquistagni]
MKLSPLKLDGAVILEPVVHGDHRGFFMESYNEQVMEQLGIKYDFIQDNQSLSTEPGVLRGLHYQLNPKAQSKLIRVLTGAIYDVILDIRKSSPTFGQWIGVILSEYNKRQLLVPKGFAHGFCTLTPNTQVLYKVDEYYSPENDHGIIWNDPALDIDWPISEPLLSDKDRKHPTLANAELNFD